MSSQLASVLVVDDEFALRNALRKSLIASGFAVGEARNGEEALNAVRLRPFDLVLFDINMPGIGGVEACGKMSCPTTKTGIVMVTVRNSENDKVTALDAGANDYVT